MKKILVVISVSLILVSQISAQNYIRVNQLGYLPESIKRAIVLSNDETPQIFEIVDTKNDRVVKKFSSIERTGTYGNFNNVYRLDFSKFSKKGEYYIRIGNNTSPKFAVNNKVYEGSADFLLNYMRQQRCGYNPFLKDSCHTHDGFIIYHPTLDSTYIDVKGGWHDASDYLQYVTTSANATFQMMFAYQQNPQAFKDNYDANGDLGSNGIPDVLDEAKWGLDWLVKMNPKKDMMFNQIADDRDHAGFRLPTADSVDYGKGFQRPVYFVTGEPQGVFENKNRTTGKASTAGKYASAFALGSQIMKEYYPAFAEKIKEKAPAAFQTGLSDTGVCQTAPCKSPYFYEEENWVDDMELAATQLYETFGDEKYFKKAVEFGAKEKATPWMGADTARHYEWYPFVNLGHYFLAKSKDEKVSERFIQNLKLGIEKIQKRASKSPFNIGVPYIWCSNNLVAAALTQISLYEKLTGDNQFAEMEAALRDWLFGCNPWGTSMIVGLPKTGDNPTHTHSAFTHLYNYQVYGGLVDGPVYASIYGRLKGLTLFNSDEYAEFQSDIVVYHDDAGDYSTDEPTMDGTASLIYYLSEMEVRGRN